MKEPAPRLNLFHLISCSYDYNLHVEGLLSANLCLVTLLRSEKFSQFERFHLQHVKTVNKTSSFDTKLIGNNADVTKITCNTLWCFIFQRSRQLISCYKLLFDQFWAEELAPSLLSPISQNINPPSLPISPPRTRRPSLDILWDKRLLHGQLLQFLLLLKLLLVQLLQLLQLLLLLGLLHLLHHLVVIRGVKVIQQLVKDTGTKSTNCLQDKTTVAFVIYSQINCKHYKNVLLCKHYSIDASLLTYNSLVFYISNECQFPKHTNL